MFGTTALLRMAAAIIIASQMVGPNAVDVSSHVALVGTCTCNVGYDLQPDGKTCLVNNCFNNNGGCDHKCHPDGLLEPRESPYLTMADGICSCDRGYDLVYGKKCVINYCYNFNGGCAHNCQPDGAFDC